MRNKILLLVAASALAACDHKDSVKKVHEEREKFFHQVEANREAAAHSASAERMTRQISEMVARDTNRSRVNSTQHSDKLATGAQSSGDMSLRDKDFGQFDEALRGRNLPELTKFVNQAYANFKSPLSRHVFAKATNGDFILKSKVMEVEGDTPIDSLAFAVPAQTVVGRDLRVLANAYQAEWIVTTTYPDHEGRSELLLAGLALLNEADVAYTQIGFVAANSFFKASDLILKFIGGHRALSTDDLDQVQVPSVRKALEKLNGMKDENDSAKLAQAILVGIPAVRTQVTKWLMQNNSSDGKAFSNHALIEFLKSAEWLPVERRLKIASLESAQTLTIKRRPKFAKMGYPIINQSSVKLETRAKWLADELDFQGIDKLASALRAVQKDFKQSGSNLSVNSSDFAATVLIKNGFNSSVDVNQLVRGYVELETRIGQIEGTDFTGQSSRAFYSTLGRGELVQAGRDIPAVLPESELDQVGLRLVMGEQEDIDRAFVEESKLDGAELYIEKEPFPLSKVFDLADEKTLRQLDMPSLQQRYEFHTLKTMLFHLARKNGFVGVAEASRDSKNFLDLTIF